MLACKACRKCVTGTNCSMKVLLYAGVAALAVSKRKCPASTSVSGMSGVMNSRDEGWRPGRKRTFNRVRFLGKRQISA